MRLEHHLSTCNQACSKTCLHTHHRKRGMQPSLQFLGKTTILQHQLCHCIYKASVSSNAVWSHSLHPETCMNIVTLVAMIYTSEWPSTTKHGCTAVNHVAKLVAGSTSKTPSCTVHHALHQATTQACLNQGWEVELQAKLILICTWLCFAVFPSPSLLGCALLCYATVALHDMLQHCMTWQCDGTKKMPQHNNACCPPH